MPVDRSRSHGHGKKGKIAMVPTPLDLENLLAPTPAKTRTTDPPRQIDLGHIHLHVRDLAAAERFYSEFLGLGVTQRSYLGALFFAAGGDHPHIGVNALRGPGRQPAHQGGFSSYPIEGPVPCS